MTDCNALVKECCVLPKLCCRQMAKMSEESTNQDWVTVSLSQFAYNVCKVDINLVFKDWLAMFKHVVQYLPPPPAVPSVYGYNGVLVSQSSMELRTRCGWILLFHGQQVYTDRQ